MSIRPKYKKVNFPIEVPKGDFCWSWALDEPTICTHFDNQGGHGTCNMGFMLEQTDKGYKKANECLTLEEAK